MAHFGELPDHCISEENAYARDRKEDRPLRRFVPDKMLFGGRYNNDTGHLPSAPGRIRYEADLYIVFIFEKRKK